jgi:flavin reductase (DIM6/NTAB) family NADH-FMN oxidoreductase RutF
MKGWTVKMKKSLGAKPLIYPQPVLIVSTYGEDGTPDAMNVAYGGIVNSNRLQINIGVRHKTSENIKAKKEFTVGIADVKNMIPADYVGIVSGNDTPDKMEKTGWTLVKSKTVDAPVIDELPITLECRLEKMNQYDQTYRVVAEIVNVLVDDSVLTEEGTVDATKLQAISYDPSTHAYLKLGSPVGQAFEDGKKIN